MRAVPLKRLARVVAGQSPPSERVEAYSGEGLPFLQGNAEFGDQHPVARYRCDSAPKHASTGDILISVRAPVGALNVADHDYGIGRGLAAIRPGAQVDARYGWWWLNSAVPILRACATGSTYDAVAAEDIGVLRMPELSRGQQRAIANYLDTETARIDALIAKKIRMTELVEARFRAWAGRLILERAVRRVPLMFLTDVGRPIVYGIVQAGREVSDGVPYVKSGDVTKLDAAKLSRTSPEIDMQYHRARVRPGDLVMAMRASIGAVAEIPDDLPRANLTQGTARIAPAPGVDKGWLLEALRTDFVQEQCRVRAVGTTFKTLNIWDLRRIVIPAPEVKAMRGLARQIADRGNVARDGGTTLRTQIALLKEHREALITAAVTGELEIPGAA